MAEKAAIHELISTALQRVLPNTWFRELPPRPTWPAAVFHVETAPEERWSMGGGYDAHDVTVAVLSNKAAELDILLPSGMGGILRPALEAMPSYQFDVSCEDGEYEDDPKVFVRVLIVRLRTPRY